MQVHKQVNCILILIKIPFIWVAKIKTQILQCFTLKWYPISWSDRFLDYILSKKFILLFCNIIIVIHVLPRMMKIRFNSNSWWLHPKSKKGISMGLLQLANPLLKVYIAYSCYKMFTVTFSKTHSNTKFPVVKRTSSPITQTTWRWI